MHITSLTSALAIREAFSTLLVIILTFTFTQFRNSEIDSLTFVIGNMSSESGSEHDVNELSFESLDEDTEVDDVSWEPQNMEEMEESDGSSLDLLPPRTCRRCGHIHHFRHIIPRKLLAFFPELKIDDPGSFMELYHLCIMMEKILEVLNGAANKKLGTYSTKYAKRKFHEKILLVKVKSKSEVKRALGRVLPTIVPDLVVDRILHFMIESNDGSPGNYTFEKHNDELLNTLLIEMYWKLADIYVKVKSLEEINFECEDCEEIVSMILKYTLDDFSMWASSDLLAFEEDEEMQVDTTTISHSINYKDEDGAKFKTFETLGNEVFDCDEEEIHNTDVDNEPNKEAIKKP